MAHSLSAKKRHRQSQKARATNRARKAAIRTTTRQFDDALQSKSAAEAQSLLRTAQERLDKSAARGTIHKNKAARRKSRMQKALNKLNAAPKA